MNMVVYLIAINYCRVVEMGGLREGRSIVKVSHVSHRWHQLLWGISYTTTHVCFLASRALEMKMLTLTVLFPDGPS